MAVRSFVEKPDAESAERYVSSGRYFWNSGMLLLPVGVFLDEVRRLQPAWMDACAKAIADGRSDLDFFRLDDAAFASAAGSGEHTSELQSLMRIPYAVFC